MSGMSLCKRKRQLLLGVLILLISLVAAIALAAVASGYIKAGKGGTIVIEEGIQLVVPPGALSEDTNIKVKMVRNTNKTTFDFSPEGLVFRKPVELRATYAAISDAASFNLYFAPDPSNPDYYTEVITPVEYDWGVTWYLNHFSLYYYRRR